MTSPGPDVVPTHPTRSAAEALSAAIEGERRFWHEVTVRPDDIAAVLAALATIDATLDDLLRYHAAQREQSAFAYVRVVQLQTMRDVARAALKAVPR